MYSEDSFFTLTPMGQFGLVTVSFGLLLGVLALASWGVKGRRLSIRITTALAIYWLFVWLSPQIYYAYYRMIIDGLPQQWVIGCAALGRGVAVYEFHRAEQSVSPRAGCVGVATCPARRLSEQDRRAQRVTRCGLAPWRVCAWGAGGAGEAQFRLLSSRPEPWRIRYREVRSGA